MERSQPSILGDLSRSLHIGFAMTQPLHTNLTANPFPEVEHEALASIKFDNIM